MKFKGLLLGLALATSLFTVSAQNDFEIGKMWISLCPY